MPARAANFSWQWALLPLLLAAALVIPALGRDIFDVDEAATMISAGARHIGPFTIAEAVAASARWPDQAWGSVVSHVLWGRVAGWSEFAVRTLPWLTGLLSLAWVYRLGRDLFTARIALTAMLLLSTSVLFLTYMHSARSYAFAMLFATIVLWGYWRVALCPRTVGPGARAALMLGATGLLYAHYFGALLLPALALFHLFFVRKERRWWQVIFLLGLAALLALPQFPDLLSGIKFNQAKEGLHAKALDFPEVTALLVRYLSNGLLNPQQSFGALLVLVLPPLLVITGWRSRNRRRVSAAASYLALTAAFQLLLLLGANEWLQVLERRRIRYLATLWPPVVLLLSQTLLRPATPFWRTSGVALVALLAFLGASDFVRQGELVLHSWRPPSGPLTIAATRTIARESNGSGLLLIGKGVFPKENRVYELYTGAWGNRLVQLYPDTAFEDLLARAWEHDQVWLLYPGSKENALRVRYHVDRFRQEGWFSHRAWRETGVTLELLDSSLTAGQTVLEFEREIDLTWSEIDLSDSLLRLMAFFHSADDYLLAHYSLAVHVIDQSGERVAQGDVGVGPGDFVTLRSEIDVSALPPGDYDLRVALYDWQSGARLTARDIGDGRGGDMHTLYSFRIG